jgi:hypothetical protein
MQACADRSQIELTETLRFEETLTFRIGTKAA